MVVNKDKLMQKEFEQKCKIETVRCAGRCDIELGDITKHNVMVCNSLIFGFYFEFLIWGDVRVFLCGIFDFSIKVGALV